MWAYRKEGCVILYLTPLLCSSSGVRQCALLPPDTHTCPNEWVWPPRGVHYALLLMLIIPTMALISQSGRSQSCTKVKSHVFTPHIRALVISLTVYLSQSGREMSFRDRLLITGRGGGYNMGKSGVRNFLRPTPSRQGKLLVPRPPPF